MKTKHLMILISILFALIIITFAYRHLTKQKLSSGTPYAKLNKDTFSKIEIIKKDKKYVFQKEYKEWDIINPISYRADQKAVNDLVDKIIGLEIGEVITTRKEKQADFEVDKTTHGVSVKIYQKDKENSIVSFILGKSAFDYLHNYFRYPGSNEIKTCKELSRYVVDKQLKNWRDKTILSLEKDKIEQIKLIYLKKTVQLTKKGNKWIIGDPEKGIEADISKINPILDTLSDLKTDDFVEKEKRENLEEFGLKNPEFQVIVKTEEREEKISIGKKDNGKYYVKRKDKDTVFLLYSFKINKLKKKRSELEKTEETKQ